jgi:hypothetical protein
MVLQIGCCLLGVNSGPTPTVPDLDQVIGKVCGGEGKLPCVGATLKCNVPCMQNTEPVHMSCMHSFVVAPSVLHTGRPSDRNSWLCVTLLAVNCMGFPLY